MIQTNGIYHFFSEHFHSEFGLKNESIPIQIQCKCLFFLKKKKKFLELENQRKRIIVSHKENHHNTLIQFS